jgi:hypothetical protein
VPQREIVVHAMKVTKRTGRVKYLSVSFTERSIPLADQFRQKLQSKLARLVRQHGRFEILVRYREDWLVIFANSFPERELDAMLNAVATELRAKMFIEPGIPLSEMTSSPSSFNFIIDLKRRRPNN